MKAVGIKIYHFSKWTLLISLIFIALLSIAGRTFLNNVDYFKGAIEQEFADYGIKGVELDNIEGHWQGLQPFLKIKRASLSIPGRSHALSINELSLRVKLIPSLLSRNLIFESFHSSIEKLVLTKDIEGAWWLNDIPLTAGTDEVSKLDIFVFFNQLPTFVNIDVGLIQLRDLRYQIDYFIQNTSLHSSRKKQKLSVELLSHLPSNLGREFQLYLTGDADDQQLYVRAESLDLRTLFQLTSLKKIPLPQAIISLQSWIALENFQIQNVITEANVRQFSFHQEDKNQQTLNFSLLQKATVQANRWILDTKIQKIRNEIENFTDINSHMLISKTGEKPQLWIEQINLSFLNSLLQGVLTDESTVSFLSNSKPDASIKNVVAELDIQHPIQSLIGFDFNGFNSQLYRSIPAIKGLDGTVLFTRDKSQIDIDAQQVILDFGDFFRAPIEFDSLVARAIVQVKDEKLFLETENLWAANKDVSLQARMNLQGSAGERPFLSIRANLENAKVEAVSNYLPVKIMHQNIVSWLDKSLQSGQITSADFLFHGRLQKPSIFNKQQSGVLLARANVVNPEIDYLDGWPVAGQGKGYVEFHNTSMNGSFEKVKYASTRVNKVNLNIADFLSASLYLKANTVTPAKDLLSTLSSLPVLNAFDEVKDKTTVIAGLVNSEVKLDIPLTSKSDKKLTVSATADLKGVSLSIPDWMINFKDLKGVVNIENEKITADTLSGNFFGDSVNLSILPDSKRKRTGLHLSGKIRSQHLLTLTPDYLQLPVSGISPWDLSVSIAHDPSEQNALLEISATSNLSGTQLDFPQPASLSKDQQSLLNFNAALFQQGDFSFELSLAEILNASGAMKFADGEAENLQWLNVFGGQKNDISSRKGVTITGKYPELDMNDWFSYQHRYFSEDTSQTLPFLQQINSIDIEVDRLLLGNQEALNSEVKIVNDGKELQGSITSSLTKGNFQLPYRQSVIRPVKADLEYLKLIKTETSEKIEIDINDMPDLYITSKALSFNNMNFTDLVLSSRSEANKFVVERLDFTHDEVKLKSSGHWQLEPKSREHVSVFNVDIKGTDFGQTVNKLGLGETIRGSSVDFNGQIGWGGELYSMNWPTLIGEVELQLKNGYLRNVDPGAGRFVGLLSFNALPKRLFLDFGDVVREGMQFNEINGKFNVHGEIMETDNAWLDSVSAKVKIQGETNLRHQTYDQTMTIVPKIGDTLPVLGAIAAGSGVGWGLLLIQKLFNKPIEKSVEIEYKVTGSWEKPEVNLIEKAKVKQESSGFDIKDL